jgi:hypothetical protein
MKSRTATNANTQSTPLSRNKRDKTVTQTQTKLRQKRANTLVIHATHPIFIYVSFCKL